MHRASQFTKLLDAVASLIQLDQRGINCRQIQAGIRTAETTKARKSRGRWANGEQLENAASQRVHDMRQLARQIAQCARGRDDHVAAMIPFVEFLLRLHILRRARRFRRPEHPRKSAVNDIGRAIDAGVDGHACVGSFRPELPSLRVQDVRFRAIKPDIRQRQLDGPLARRLLLQRNVAPEGDRERIFPRVRGDDFLAQALRFAQVGAQQRPPAPGKTLRRPKTKANAITDKTQQAFSGRGSHNQFIHADLAWVLSLNST